MTLTIESLGITRDEILDRVVAKIADQIISDAALDEDGVPTGTPTKFARILLKKVQARIDTAVEEIAGRHVLPNVAAYVENLCLQETNRWGEKVGKPVTFIEHLVQRAEAYLREDVDHNGKTKGEDSYSWRKSGTRVAYMIHEHLQYSISSAMADALKNANSAIVGGIQEAVKIKLAEVAASLKVETKIR